MAQKKSGRNNAEACGRIHSTVSHLTLIPTKDRVSAPTATSNSLVDFVFCMGVWSVKNGCDIVRDHAVGARE